MKNKKSYLKPYWSANFKTQQEFARVVGSSPSFLCQIDSGLRPAPLNLAKKLHMISGGKIPVVKLVSDRHLNDLIKWISCLA